MRYVKYFMPETGLEERWKQLKTLPLKEAKIAG